MTGCRLGKLIQVYLRPKYTSISLPYTRLMKKPPLNKVYISVGLILSILLGGLFYYNIPNINSALSVSGSILGLMFTLAYWRAPERDTDELRAIHTNAIPIDLTEDESCFVCSKDESTGRKIVESKEVVLFGRAIICLDYREDILCSDHYISSADIDKQFDKKLNEPEQKKQFLEK